MLTEYLAEQQSKRIDSQTAQEYQTKFVPKAIAENRYNIDPEHFLKYQKLFMNKKKSLEIQVIRDNKKQEILQRILCEDKPFI